MRVLFQTNIPSPYRVEFFNALGKMCDLTVLYERDSAYNRNNRWKAVHNENIKIIFLKGIKISTDSSLCLEVYKWLKKGLFDIFVVGGYSTPTGVLMIETLKLKKIPFIINADGGLIKKESNFKYFIKRHLISSANYWLSTGFITNNFLKHYGANVNNIYEYPFTSISEKDILKLPIDKIQKKIFREKLGISEENIILSVGQFIYRKGYDILLKTCEMLPKNYGIYIVGGVPTEEYLRMKEKMGLSNVHFVSFKTKKCLAKYYLAADLFVLPTREDIWGLVINEAMAYALPVITTNKCVAGLEMINDDENGFIVDVENKKMLAQKILDVLENHNLLGEMGKNNLKKINNYTIENMALEHMKIFENIMKRNNK